MVEDVKLSHLIHEVTFVTALTDTMETNASILTIAIPILAKIVEDVNSAQ